MSKEREQVHGDWLKEQLFWEPERFQVTFVSTSANSAWNQVSKRMQTTSRLTVGADSIDARSRYYAMRQRLRTASPMVLKGSERNASVFEYIQSATEKTSFETVIGIGR